MFVVFRRRVFGDVVVGWKVLNLQLAIGCGGGAINCLHKGLSNGSGKMKSAK
jgi:hypothetical protein